VTYQTQLVTVTGGVASVTLNRPEVRNALAAAATATELEYGAALRYLREMLTLVAMSDDAKEAIAAFFEKRPARWSGR
jgi:enoyl-CoA hydratase/carnithine racemase